MSTLALEEVQQALFTTLGGDAMLMDEITAIHDHVPSDAAYPFLVIGDGQQQAIAADTDAGARCNLRLQSYSRDHGRKRTLIILKRLYVLLHHGSIAVSSGRIAHIRVQDLETRLHTNENLVEGIMDITLLFDHLGGA